MAAVAQVRHVTAGQQQVLFCPTLCFQRKRPSRRRECSPNPTAATLSKVEGPTTPAASPPPVPAALHVTPDVQEGILRGAHNAGNPVSIHVIIGKFLRVRF